MKLPYARFIQLATATTVVSIFLASAAHAGPPLICHTIEIGQAKSLPWISHAWNLSGVENYDLKNLTPDTLAILDSGAPVLVRMETLRRATLYARKDPQIARELLAKLQDRVTKSENAGHPDAMALFDAGYLIECYKQWIGKDLPHMTDGLPLDPNPAVTLDGYAMVKKAISLRGQDPEMEFAAALITLDGQRADYQVHVARATSGASKDTLLAQNLSRRFMGSSGITVAEMFAKSGAANP